MGNGERRMFVPMAVREVATFAPTVVSEARTEQVAKRSDAAMDILSPKYKSLKRKYHKLNELVANAKVKDGIVSALDHFHEEHSRRFTSSLQDLAMCLPIYSQLKEEWTLKQALPGIKLMQQKVDGKVDNFVTNSFCRLLFLDHHPSKSKKHYFFNTIEMRGTILPGHKWDVMVDLFFHRDPEEAKEQEEEEAVVGPEYAAVEYGVEEMDDGTEGQEWGAPSLTLSGVVATLVMNFDEELWGRVRLPRGGDKQNMIIISHVGNNHGETRHICIEVVEVTSIFLTVKLHAHIWTIKLPQNNRPEWYTTEGSCHFVRKSQIEN
ncbi:hypothetical protein E2562_028642 [Oryza meyeriana var. granulata]|uniref:Uncharacterized protein n=1 Tax=Oryza meyeriana var. granulata TaxID=110450 RepID=A0A6G1D932_9ORYZ|nr:hypothetical protein E2562_028642 [Oryza meyeriana var. granulata]